MPGGFSFYIFLSFFRGVRPDDSGSCSTSRIPGAVWSDFSCNARDFQQHGRAPDVGCLCRRHTPMGKETWVGWKLPTGFPIQIVRNRCMSLTRGESGLLTDDGRSPPPNEHHPRCTSRCITDGGWVWRRTSPRFGARCGRKLHGRSRGPSTQQNAEVSWLGACSHPTMRIPGQPVGCTRCLAPFGTGGTAPLPFCRQRSRSRVFFQPGSWSCGTPPQVGFWFGSVWSR
jgi:hypothetical protein